MANQTNGNQFRDDEIVVLTENRDGKLVKSIHPKIGGRHRVAHEENEQLSITSEIIKYDENLALAEPIASAVFDICRVWRGISRPLGDLQIWEFLHHTENQGPIAIPSRV
jgi:hypothetical protein